MQGLNAVRESATQQNICSAQASTHSFHACTLHKTGLNQHAHTPPVASLETSGRLVAEWSTERTEQGHGCGQKNFSKSSETLFVVCL